MKKINGNYEGFYERGKDSDLCYEWSEDYERFYERGENSEVCY